MCTLFTDANIKVCTLGDGGLLVWGFLLLYTCIWNKDGQRRAFLLDRRLGAMLSEHRGLHSDLCVDVPKAPL